MGSTGGGKTGQEIAEVQMCLGWSQEEMNRMGRKDFFVFLMPAHRILLRWRAKRRL